MAGIVGSVEPTYKGVDGDGWTRRAQYPNIDEIVGCGGFRLRLSAEGQELFAEMEPQVLAPEQPVKSRENWLPRFTLKKTPVLIFFGLKAEIEL